MTPALILAAVSGAAIGSLVTGYTFYRKLRAAVKWGRGYQQRALESEQLISDMTHTVYVLHSVGEQAVKGRYVPSRN